MPGAEAITYRIQRGATDASSGMDTAMLDPDVLRVGALPADVVAGESWNYNDVTYTGVSRRSFELHLEANGGAWTQRAGDRRYYHFAHSVTYASGRLTLRLVFPTAPGNLTNGLVNERPVAWTAASSAWTSTPGQYEYTAPIADNPIPTIGEFVIGFTTANAELVWYPQGQTAQEPFFSGKDAHIMSAFDTGGYADIPDAMAQRGWFTTAQLPTISDLNGVGYGTTRSWVGGSADTYYAGWRVPVARKGEIRSFHARIGNAVSTNITVLGDDQGQTYGYITMYGYTANTEVALQALGKVSLDASRLDTSDWNEALGAYFSGTYAGLPAAAPAGSRAIVYGDIVGRNGTYYKLNTGWVLIGSTPGVFADKAGLDAVASPNGAYAMVVAEAARGLYLRTGGAWVQVGNVAAAAPDDGATIAELLRALAADTPAGRINPARIPQLGYTQMPASVAAVGKAFRRGGERDWPNDDLQIGALIQQAAFSGLPQNYAFRAGTQPGHTQVAVRDEALGGVEAANVHVLVRASKTAYPERPTIADLPKMQFRLGYEGESPVIRPALTAVVVIDANYWYMDALVPNLPADANIYMEINEPPIIDAGLEDGTLTPAMIDLEGDPVEGGYYSYHDGQFQMRRAAGWDQLYRGSQGITLNGLAGNSPIIRLTYNDAFNLNRAHDGYYLYEVTLTWVAGHDPSTLAFDTDGGATVSASGQVALFQVKATSAYDGSANLGEVALRIPVYAGAGSDTHIGDVVYRSDRAANYDGAS